MSKETYHLILYFGAALVGIAFADAYLNIIDTAMTPLMEAVREL